MKTIYAVFVLFLIGCGGEVADSCPRGDTCTPEDAGVHAVSMVEAARLLCVAQVCERGECGVAPVDDCIGEIVTCAMCGDR